MLMPCWCLCRWPNCVSGCGSVCAAGFGQGAVVGECSGDVPGPVGHAADTDHTPAWWCYSTHRLFNGRAASLVRPTAAENTIAIAVQLKLQCMGSG